MVLEIEETLIFKYLVHFYSNSILIIYSLWETQVVTIFSCCTTQKEHGLYKLIGNCMVKKYYKGLVTVSISRTYVSKCRQFGFYSLLGFWTKN